MSWLSRWDRRNQRLMDERRDTYRRVVTSPVGDRYYELTAQADVGPAGFAAEALGEAGVIGFVLGLGVEFLDWLLRRRPKGGDVRVVVRSTRTGDVVVSTNVDTMDRASALLDNWETIIAASGVESLLT